MAPGLASRDVLKAPLKENGSSRREDIPEDRKHESGLRYECTVSCRHLRRGARGDGRLRGSHAHRRERDSWRLCTCPPWKSYRSRVCCGSEHELLAQCRPQNPCSFLVCTGCSPFAPHDLAPPQVHWAPLQVLEADLLRTSSLAPCYLPTSWLCPLRCSGRIQEEDLDTGHPLLLCCLCTLILRIWES